jgi:hypothetical protein
MNLAELITEADRCIRTTGTLVVTGRLTDWRTHPSGLTTAELNSEQPNRARLRVVAGRHAAHAASQELADIGRSTSQPGEVTAHGQLGVHPQFGLQLTLYRLQAEGPFPTVVAEIPSPNTSTRWPNTIAIVGLVAPEGGDDAVADVHAICDPAGIVIIDQRVSFTGRRSSIAIAHALDLLALDPRPAVTLLVRGGGPTSDFAPLDSRIVVAAIGRHPRPVITGLGHAANRTAADLAAHTNCITPTAAAQTICGAHVPATGG